MEEHPPRTDVSDERGVALIVTLMAISLLMALGLALTLTAMTEGHVAHSYERAVEASYAADAALELAIAELAAVPNWDDVLSGAVRSSLAEGAPGGGHLFPGGATIDLTNATNELRCAKPLCTEADLAAVTEERPWRANNPRWQPFLYGPLDAVAPNGIISSDLYVIVWAADDPSENDDDASRDGGVPVGCDPKRDPGCEQDNAGRGVLTLLAQARGPDGTRRSIEAAVARTGPGRPDVRVRSWRHQH